MFKPCPPGLRSSAGGWLMIMDSISLSDFTRLHCQLATVLTSSFNGNHWIVWLCSAYMCVCMVLEKIFTNSYKLVKNNSTFSFCSLAFIFHTSQFLTTMDHSCLPWSLLPRLPNLFPLGNSIKFFHLLSSSYNLDEKIKGDPIRAINLSYGVAFLFITS